MYALAYIIQVAGETNSKRPRKSCTVRPSFLLSKQKGAFTMYGIQSSPSIATTSSNCAIRAERSYRYRVTIVSEQLELDDGEMPVPQDCQTIEVWAKLVEEIPALVTISHPGYKVVDSWQPIERECPF
ncbi:hypothetical protein C7B80_29560 [Cyanosarcina cf. burmensis CCALA 770]|nr:hypothetical protein C7B80_29560 [Cyanosarcina cf. burmensis CCALA 770]